MNLPEELNMYSLFNSPIVFNPALNKVSGWNETRRAVLDEMNRLAIYYNQTAAWSKNQNVLNQILNTLDISPNKDKNYVAEMARNDFADKIGMFGLFSSTITSKIQPLPQFYNQGSMEVLVYDDSYFDANLARMNWKHLEPVKILDHPFDDVNLGLPDFNYRADINRHGLIIISINVAMLIVQFHYWVESLTKAPADLEVAKAQFIMRYPLFNAIKSQTDIAIRNRFFRLYNNEPVSKFLKVHPVMIRDISRLMDNSLRNTCHHLKNKSLTYNELLQQIPAVMYDNQYQVLKLPDIAATRPIKWALDLTRLRTIHNLLRYEQALPNGSIVEAASATSTAPRNLHTRAYIKRKLYNLENAQAIPIQLDLDTKQLITDLGSWL